MRAATPGRKFRAWQPYAINNNPYNFTLLNTMRRLRVQAKSRIAMMTPRICIYIPYMYIQFLELCNDGRHISIAITRSKVRPTYKED